MAEPKHSNFSKTKALQHNPPTLRSKTAVLVEVQKAPPPDYSRHRILSTKAIVELTSIGKSQIHKLVSDGKFPTPIQISSGRVGYLEDEVLRWIDQRIAERNQLAIKRGDQ